MKMGNKSRTTAFLAPGDDVGSVRNVFIEFGVLDAFLGKVALWWSAATANLICSSAGAQHSRVW